MPGAAPLHDRFAADLWSRHPFQLAYVTSDLDRAVEAYGELLGATEFLRFESRKPWVMADGEHELEMAVALAWLGDLTIELIQPLGGHDAIYREVLGGESVGLRFHHVGYRLSGTLERALELRDAQPEGRVRMSKQEGEDTLIFYVDTRPELGHYVEYLWWSPEAATFLDSLPRN